MAGQNAPMHSVLVRRDLPWQGYVDAEVVPVLRQHKLKDVIFHMPFGTTDGWFSFDSLIHAREAGLKIVYEGFTEAVSRITLGFYSDGEPVRVICYMGSITLDPAFRQLQTEPEAWTKRAMDSIQPIAEAGCGVAFDTAGPWPVEEPAHWFVGLLRRLGTEVFIEGTERVERPQNIPQGKWVPRFGGHWRGFGVVARNQHFWDNIVNSNHPDARWDNPSLYGEKLLLFTGHGFDDYAKQVPPLIAANMRLGYSSAAIIGRLNEDFRYKSSMVAT
jgi:hypothetical protein